MKLNCFWLKGYWVYWLATETPPGYAMKHVWQYSALEKALGYPPLSLSTMKTIRFPLNLYLPLSASFDYPPPSIFTKHIVENCIFFETVETLKLTSNDKKIDTSKQKLKHHVVPHYNEFSRNCMLYWCVTVVACIICDLGRHLLSYEMVIRTEVIVTTLYTYSSYW